MERREGFFERRRRQRAEETASREAAFSILEKQMRATLEQQLDRSRQVNQREAQQVQELERRKRIRHQIAGTIELGRLGKQGEGTFVRPEVRDPYLILVRRQILNMWRTDRTISIEDEIAQATSLIGIEEQVAGFELMGIKYPLRREPSPSVNNERYVNDDDLRTIYEATGATREQLTAVFGKPKDK